MISNELVNYLEKEFEQNESMVNAIKAIRCREKDIEYHRKCIIACENVIDECKELIAEELENKKGVHKK